MFFFHLLSRECLEFFHVCIKQRGKVKLAVGKIQSRTLNMEKLPRVINKSFSSSTTGHYNRTL